MRSAWLILLCACGGPALVPTFADQPTEPDELDAGAPVANVHDAGQDAGGPSDAGARIDAGAPIDAGAGPDDAGSPMEAQDAGMTGPGEDAGAPVNAPDSGVIDRGPGRLPRDGGDAPDAGAEPTDAGLPVIDAGVTLDAGLPAIDAGAAPPTPDAGWTHTGPWGVELSPHLPLGAPDGASVGRLDAWLLVRAQLAVSYDTRNKVPNWSAWLLDSAWLGTATRATTFRSDPLLPTGTPQAKDSDYTNSGFDRGHLCPSADRTASDADNDATFFLTNVVPQTHASNAGPWLDLEDFERTLAAQGKHLWIIAGPLFGATRQTIGTGVAVPLSMFKVIVVTDGAVTPGAITPQTITYAAIIPNVSPLSGSWRQWQVSVDDVEALTGLDLLSDVDPAIQASVERTRLP